MKKTISVFLAVLMLLSIIPFAVSAADDSDKQVKFITNVDGIQEIDFSAVIRDKATINKGRIVLDNKGDTDTDPEAVWFDVEIDETGLARFFWNDETGEKYYTYIPLSIYDWEVEIRAVYGNLFDDVESYSFSVTDVYTSTGTETFWASNHPLVEVTKCDGDLVKEMEFCFAPADGPLLPLTVDMEKEIDLTVSFRNTEIRTYTLVPVKYDGEGTLTVSVRNTDGSEGVALHDAKFYIGERSLSLYSFSFLVPHGLFRYNDMESEGFFTTDYTEDEIWNMPVQTVMNIQTSERTEKILDTVLKFIPSTLRYLYALMLIPVLFPFPVTRLYRAIRTSLAAYGYDLDGMVKDAVRSGKVKDVLVSFLRNLFK